MNEGGEGGGSGTPHRKLVFVSIMVTAQIDVEQMPRGINGEDREVVMEPRGVQYATHIVQPPEYEHDKVLQRMLIAAALGNAAMKAHETASDAGAQMHPLEKRSGDAEDDDDGSEQGGNALN